MTRRPSWATPLILGEELLMLLYEIEWLGVDDLAVARLWANFTDPRRGKVSCEGFELRVGLQRNGKLMWRGQYFDKASVVANLKRNMETARSPEARQHLEQYLRQTEAKTGGWSFEPWWAYATSGPGADWAAKHPNRIRVVKLSEARVLDFCGAPGEQMRAAGKYCGHCCCCGKALTDPHSLEYGIGPECRHKFGVTAPEAPGAWIIGGMNASTNTTDDSQDFQLETV